MGRKIPGKKHRGIKDPAVQKENKLKKIITKIDAPPKDPDEQHIPKSLQRVMDLTQKVKDGTISLKRKRKSKKQRESKIERVTNQNKHNSKGRPEKATPVFKQRSDENDRAFMNRVNNIVQSVLVENEFEQKYGVDVRRNPVTGEVEGVTKKPKDEIDELMKKAKKEKLNPIDKKKKKKKDAEPRLTKAQKRKKKIEDRKRKKQELFNNKDEFSKYKDDVKFGEIVHAPPSLQRPKLKLKNDIPTLGNKDLLLKAMLKGNKENKTENKSPKTAIHTIKRTTGHIDKKGKRKDLPIGTRLQLERYRDEVVKAYKLLKNKQ